jgi:hypothetical protein
MIGSAVVLIGVGRRSVGRDDGPAVAPSLYAERPSSLRRSLAGVLASRTHVCQARPSGYSASRLDPTKRGFALSEQHTEQTIKVRQITDVHANWSSQGPLENGKFSYQLILDNGAEEALIMPTADDAKVLRDLIHDADTLYWDTDKEVIIFGKVN